METFSKTAPVPTREAKKKGRHKGVRDAAIALPAPGELVTLRHVAARAGTGIATASRALAGNGSVSPQKREAVLKAAQELSFSPNPNAQRLVGGRGDDSIALFSTILDLGVGTHKLQLLQDLLSERGYQTPIYAYRASKATPQSQHALMMQVCRRRYRAVVCGTSGPLAPQAVAELDAYARGGGIVVVYSYGVHLPIDCDHVMFDVADNTYSIARHLLELGHRKIGYFFAGHNTVPNTPREAGLRRALEEFGVSLPPEWMFLGQGRSEHENEGRFAAQTWLQMAPHQRPTAMCIVNDTAAMAFIATVQAAGVRVPDDLSVVGHDDKPIAQFSNPPLTTVSHPVEAIAQKVVDFLQERLDGTYKGPARLEVVRGQVVVRQSTAPFKGA